MTDIQKDLEHINFTSWSEIFDEPRYTDLLDHKTEKLKKIIDNYEFPTQEKCGLKNCRTPHNKGYVAITETGKLTNIGQICGKKHFGADFHTLSKQFKRDSRDYQAYQNIKSHIEKAEYYRKRVDRINRDFGNIYHYHKIQLFFTQKSKNCPTEVFDKAHKMIRIEIQIFIELLRLAKRNMICWKQAGKKTLHAIRKFL